MISASCQIGERCLRGEPHGGHLLPTDATEPTQGCLVTVGDTRAESVLLLDEDCHLGRRLGLRLGWDHDRNLLEGWQWHVVCRRDGLWLGDLQTTNGAAILDRDAAFGTRHLGDVPRTALWVGWDGRRRIDAYHRARHGGVVRTAYAAFVVCISKTVARTTSTRGTTGTPAPTPTTTWSANACENVT